MTVHDVVVVMLRRWYVVLGVFVLTALGGFALYIEGGTYTTTTAVRFVNGDYATILPDNGSEDEDIVVFATVIAREVNGGKATTGYATAAAPFYGAGVRQGVLVSLPNVGGQWQAYYATADVNLQIISPSRDWVRREQKRLIAEVEELAAARQDQLHVPRTSRITTSVAPLSAEIEYVAPSRGTALAAFSALGFAALLTSGWLAVSTERALDRRASRNISSSEGEP